MVDLVRQRRQAAPGIRYRLEWSRGDELLEHETSGEDHEVSAVDIRQMLVAVERFPPARDRLRKRRMIDMGGGPARLKQEFDVLLEGPHDGPEPARLVTEVVELEDFRFERRKH